ncbi:MAG: hypothetical protein Q8P45_00595 [Candidatus Harrisonbacteria bacterium]|nr:hypothetical protein [Candidatus Harrisonbacteria bacterium]
MPQKKRQREQWCRLLSRCFVSAIVLLFVGGVFLYNGLVQLEDSADELSRALQEQKLLNSTLKDQLYGQLDFSSLSELAAKLYLVEDVSPSYLKLDSSSQHLSTND